MLLQSLPPAVPIKVTSGYHATGALPAVTAAKLEPAALPLPLPKSLGFFKTIGNMNTAKVAALDALDTTVTFRAAPGSSVEQAVLAAAQLAHQLPHHSDGPGSMSGMTSSYMVLATGDDLYVTPMWYKNEYLGQRIGTDVDWQGDGANDQRGTAARASAPMFVAAVGATRWIDTRGTVKQ